MPVFKCPLQSPHVELQKMPVFLGTKIGIFWNRLSKFKKQTHSEILLLNPLESSIIKVSITYQWKKKNKELTMK